MTHWRKLEVAQVDRADTPVTVFRLDGVLTGSPESYAFLETVSEIVRKGRNRLVLNMKDVEHMTSSGVGIVAACYTSVKNAEGKITLALVPSRVRTLLNVLCLLEILGEFASEDEAVKHVSG